MFTALFSGMINFRHIYRNRLFIIGLHIVAWTCFLLLPFFIYRLRILHPSFFIREVIDNLFLIGVFYLNIYVLIPRFFTLKKIVYYFACVLAVLVFITMQQAVMDHYFVRYLAKHEYELGLHAGITEKGARMISVDSSGNVTFRGPRAFMRYRAFSSANGGIYAYTKGRPLGKEELRFSGGIGHGPRLLIRNDSVATAMAMPAMPLGPPPFWQRMLFPEALRKPVLAALLMLLMSGFIKIAQEWFKSEQQREALKVEKLNAELKFLKSQINPHFLFNCLNTIYSLAHKHSTQTEHAIVKLSTIMRYMIYESNEEMVQLQHELQYLRDYIDIQRLRLPAGIQVDYTECGAPDGLWIEPMLLIPFVENAFKHGISYTDHSFISIAITIEQTTVRLLVKNSLFPQRVAEQGGIGLQNVLKRLDLLYTNKHEITVTETDNQFIADLKIVLKND
ncbi:sensor histidine kinase [uncultured Chitinophaga sp.]|jgi:Putative regulator of cell autolysis|uniref:sensor histidine kinase n=1 Tax=uncultured Chitinophaga sp. TaxID=339340 RepID=UPI00261F0B72|nr:sensor histidine kinase [uncultured Chitinophaga sp.]